MPDAIDVSTEYMVTTIDNPFNPFTQFEEWFQWDVSAGYNTAALLGRLANSSSELSEPDQAVAIQQAIDEMVEENVTGKYRKVARPS